MIVLILVALALILAGIVSYFYFFLRRVLASMDACAPKWVLILTSCLIVAAGLLLDGFVLVVELHFLMFDCLVRLLALLVRKWIPHRLKKLIHSGVLPLVLVAVVLFCGYYTLHNVVQTDYTVYTEKNIRTEGYRIALVADVHFGVSLDEEALLEKCREIEAQEPDIVILCGDIVDHSTDAVGMQSVFAAFGSIKSELGVFYVYGNHDRPTRHMKGAYSQEELEECMLSNGITILQDQVLALTKDLVLVGREDRSVKNRKMLTELLSGFDTDCFVLTLDHQPCEYKENAKAGSDLVLSGHTHGGQLFPIDYLQELIPFNDGVYGKYSLSNGGVAIITSGFGTWSYPIKTAAPAEYVMIEVLKK